MNDLHHPTNGRDLQYLGCDIQPTMCVIIQTPGASLVSDALQAIEQFASMGIFNVLFADECRVMLQIMSDRSIETSARRSTGS